MAIVIPVFDVQALYQWAELADPPPVDQTRHALWNQLRTDVVAAADHIELLEAALAEAKGETTCP